MNPLPKDSWVWVQPRRTQMNTIEVTAVVSGLPLDSRYHEQMCIMLMLVAGIPTGTIRSCLGIDYYQMATHTDHAIDAWRGDKEFKACYDTGVEAINQFRNVNARNWVQTEEKTPQSQLHVLPRIRTGRRTVEGKKRTLAKRNSKAMGKP